MKMNEVFNINRFWLLCRHAIGKEGKAVINNGWKFVVIFFILTLFLRLTGNGIYELYSVYMLVIISDGIYCALNAFKNLRDKNLCISWLLLPGSTLEKFLSRVLYVLIIYFVLLSAAYTVGVNIGILFSSFLFGGSFYIFLPFNNIGFLNGYAIYFLLTSIFFTGGLYFRKGAFVKTIFFILIISIVIEITIAVFGVIIAAYGFEYLVKFFPDILRYWGELTRLYFNSTFLFLIPVFCWLISYVRMKERLIVEIED